MNSFTWTSNSLPNQMRHFLTIFWQSTSDVRRNFIPTASHSVASCPSVCRRSRSAEANQTLSTHQLHLEILSMKILNRICDEAFAELNCNCLISENMETAFAANKQGLDSEKQKPAIHFYIDVRPLLVYKANVINMQTCIFQATLKSCGNQDSATVLIVERVVCTSSRIA